MVVHNLSITARVCYEPVSIAEPFQDDPQLISLKSRTRCRSNMRDFGRSISSGSSKRLLQAIEKGPKQALCAAGNLKLVALICRLQLSLISRFES